MRDAVRPTACATCSGPMPLPSNASARLSAVVREFIETDMREFLLRDIANWEYRLVGGEYVCLGIGWNW